MDLRLLIKLIFLNVVRIVLRLYCCVFEKPKRNCIPPIEDDLLLKPAVVIADQIRQGKLKCKDVVGAYLRRAKLVNKQLNAIVDTNKNALKEAEEIDALVKRELSGQKFPNDPSIHDMPLIGVPFTVKDSVAIKGLIFSGGLYARRNIIAKQDAEIVANLRKAGAVPTVLTNVPDLLMWNDSVSILVGVTHNPYDLTKSPGGSSGGEGALISSGASLMGIGSDVGGSIRNPSYRCGIFGHKVTPTVMSTVGEYPTGREPYNTTGPMCRYVDDLIPMLKGMAGDRISKIPLIDTQVDLSTIKVYYMFEDNNILKPRLQADVRDGIKRVVKHFETKVKVECIQVYFEEFAIIDEVYYQLFSEKCDFHEEMSNGGPRINLAAEAIKAMMGLSEYTFRTLLYAYICQFDPNFDQSKLEKFYKFKAKFINLLGSNGVFFYPTFNQVTQNSTETSFDFYPFRFTGPFNVLTVPVTQCPIGLNKDGLPLGLQVVTAPYNDHISLAVAKEIARAFGGWVPPCKIND